MNCFIRLDTQQFPFYEGDIRLEHPEISEELTGDSFPVPNGYARLQVTPQPAFDADTQILNPMEVENINGVWRIKWTFRDLTPVEIESLRKAKENFDASLNKPSITVPEGTQEVLDAEPTPSESGVITESDLLNNAEINVVPMNP